ncbi:hypothetical protein SUGI_1157640 [Cryptomeria japonica]|nr:hypothetical protein SUGI_1157640 [Cryptomeria japonica]
MEVDVLTAKIQLAIEEVINGKSIKCRYTYYSRWDMEMEQVWYFRQWSCHTKKSKNSERSLVKWSLPPAGWKKMNFDGASRGNPSVSGFGAVIRDEVGNLIGALSGPIGVATNNVAEITALAEGLNWAYSKGISKIVIEGDSRIILDGIVKKCFSNWKLDTWSTRIGLLLSKFDDFRVHHIFWEGNKVTDFLANQGISDDLTVVVFEADDSCRELQVLISEDRDQIPRDGIG